MPDDVSLDPGGVTASAAGQHAWTRGLAWWHGVFGMVLVAVLLLLWSAPDNPGQVKMGVTALAAGAAGWYAGVGSRALRRRSTRLTLLYLSGMLALFVPAVWLFPSTALLLAAICGHCFLLLDVRWAVIAVAAFNAVPLSYVLSQTEWHPRTVLGILAWVTLALGASSLFALWIRRIIVQSEERAELIEQLEATRAELAAANHAAGALAERERLAAEIHDTVAQGFTSVLMLLQAVESEVESEPQEARRHLGLAADTARENLGEARTLIAALAPARLEHDTLTEALRRLVEHSNRTLGVPATFDFTGDPRPLPAGLEVVVLRSTQEGLMNVHKHAGASRVQVRLGYGNGNTAAVHLEVEDDGRGFEPLRVRGFGLRAMRTRVAHVGGSLEVHSSPGAGTRIRLVLP